MIKKLILILLLCSLSLAAVEDFTTYTTVGVGITSSAITITDLWSRQETQYAYKDYGAAHFSGDFTHTVKFNLTATSTGAAVYFWGLSDVINDFYLADVNGDNWTCAYIYQQQMGFNVCADGNLTSTVLTNISLSTDYFLTIERDDDAGANSTGQYTYRIYTVNYYGEAGAIELATLTLDCAAGQQDDYQYGYIFSGHDTGGVADGQISSIHTDFDFGGGVENLTLFEHTVFLLDVTDAETITWAGFKSRGSSNYIYKDLGAAYFNGDFTHTFKHTLTFSQNRMYGFMWAITNDIDDLGGIDVASGDYQAVGIYDNAGTRYIRISICEGGTLSETGLTNVVTNGTTYFYTVVRDDDAGADSTGQITLYVCTGAYYGEGGAALVHTITEDCAAGEQNDFRYIHATQGYYISVISAYSNGTVEDLDLAYVAPVGGGGQLIKIQEF